MLVKHYAPNHMLASTYNRGIIKILWNVSKRWTGHLHHVPKLYAWYHDPRILPNVDQALYTLDTNCMPYIMILAQAVIQYCRYKVVYGLNA